MSSVVGYLVGVVLSLLVLVLLAGLFNFYAQITFRVFRPTYCDRTAYLTDAKGQVWKVTDEHIWTCEI